MKPKVGDLFRRYQILGPAAKGGMGDVYRAHDTRLERDVALKFLTQLGHLDPEKVARLREEAKSLAALNHPNIITIYDIDEEDGMPFLVLEWLSGMTLNDPKYDKIFSIKNFFKIVLPFAEALGAAHERGIVHRDIKPGNVMISEINQVKLLDFGLAQFRQTDSNSINSVTTEGTMAYMSPEQALGELVESTSDIFSFGIIAYKMLTGKLPFEEVHSSALTYSIINQDHIPLKNIQKDFSSELANLIDKCLEKDPKERFENGIELFSEINKIFKGKITNTPVVSKDINNAQNIIPVVSQQNIKFCNTSDGVKIAYSVIGNGPILVRVLGWFTHLEKEWEWPELRTFWENLSEQHTVLRYDGRGMGLSDPFADEFTEETRRCDLEAVLSAMDAESFSLLGISEGGWLAASYANDYPKRVNHLVLYGAYCRGVIARPNYDAEEQRALITLIRKGWGRDTASFRQIFTSQFFHGDLDLRVVAHFDNIQRTSADPETAARYVDSIHSRGDGRDFFSKISVPTLVIHSKDDQVVDFEEGRLLAAIIPEAQLLPLPSGTHYFPSSQNQEVFIEVVDAIDRHTGIESSN
jgi:serine/threonine protein kinase